MRCLHIQLQPELCTCEPTTHVAALIGIATAHAPDAVVNVERGNDDGPYVNINIETEDIRSLWQVVGREIATNSLLASATIVCCEGDNGWDDYLLLHHYDKTETLDTLN